MHKWSLLYISNPTALTIIITAVGFSAVNHTNSLVISLFHTLTFCPSALIGCLFVMGFHPTFHQSYRSRLSFPHHWSGTAYLAVVLHDKRMYIVGEAYCNDRCWKDWTKVQRGRCASCLLMGTSNKTIKSNKTNVQFCKCKKATIQKQDPRHNKWKKAA